MRRQARGSRGNGGAGEAPARRGSARGERRASRGQPAPHTLTGQRSPLEGVRRLPGSSGKPICIATSTPTCPRLSPRRPPNKGPRAAGRRRLVPGRRRAAHDAPPRRRLLRRGARDGGRGSGGRCGGRAACMGSAPKHALPNACCESKRNRPPRIDPPTIDTSPTTDRPAHKSTQDRHTQLTPHTNPPIAPGRHGGGG